MNKEISVSSSLSNWLFGLVVFAIGIVNTFWGNDPGFGVFLLLLSFVYFPPAINYIKSRFGLSLPIWIKIALGLFIIWAALGVGELFDKINLMRMSF
ncbi:hypothetical protein [Rufibacter aurantiacus]|uniref:hypothetical protein n=1 Tax=Rufibacter aurantiacus TaxID=2817374 RepID=UPI001B301314|nr:hypothetical protein [Rufibacter aurantiacus]